MTKNSKQTKLKELFECSEGNILVKRLAPKYKINYSNLQRMIATYSTHGSNVILNPPKVTPEF